MAEKHSCTNSERSRIVCVHTLRKHTHTHVQVAVPITMSVCMQQLQHKHVHMLLQMCHKTLSK